MIKFFRKIRQKLLSENKFSKYLIYAVGEIVLVVIGILLALQINNWNDARKNDDKFKIIFSEIDQDLERIIESSDAILESYMIKDSLIYIVMHNKVSGADYEKASGLSGLLTNERILQIPKSGFTNLMTEIENVPNQYKSLIKNLKIIYNEIATDIKEIESDISDSRKEYYQYLTYNQLWYSRYYFSKSQLSKEEINYYLSDFYRNAVFNYSIDVLDNHRPGISIIREMAFNSRLQLAKIIDNVSNELPDHSDYAHMEGNYISEEDTIRITRKNKALYFKYNSFPESILIPFDKSRFMAYRSWFCYLQYDEQNEVIGISERRGDNIIEYKKYK